jgi:hypothetical protein
MLKKTPSEKFCQKGPTVGGGTPAAGDTWHLPPLASPAGPCRRWHRRHVRPPSSRVTWPNGGGGMPPCRQWGWRHGPCPCHLPGPALPPAAGGGGGMPLPCHLPPVMVAACCLPAMPTAAGATCRLPRGCRHPQPVLFDKTFRRGSFLALHSRRWSNPSKIREFCPLCIPAGLGVHLPIYSQLDGSHCTDIQWPVGFIFLY